MSREVRRVPMGWQHPMEWQEAWNFRQGRMKMQLLPKPMLNGSDYKRHLSSWNEEAAELACRQGTHWEFRKKYHLTGYRREESEPLSVRPFEVAGVAVEVRDEDHLYSLLTADHIENKPSREDYMPDFAEHDPDTLGWAIYETTSEGTPLTPTFATPEELATWCVEHKVSTFGDFTADYDSWLAMIHYGWAPSAVISPGGGFQSGVEAVTRKEDNGPCR